jgi:hypothetical protein
LLHLVGDLSGLAEEVKVSSNRFLRSWATSKGVIVESVVGIVELVAKVVLLEIEPDVCISRQSLHLAHLYTKPEEEYPNLRIIVTSEGVSLGKTGKVVRGGSEAWRRSFMTTATGGAHRIEPEEARHDARLSGPGGSPMARHKRRLTGCSAKMRKGWVRLGAKGNDVAVAAANRTVNIAGEVGQPPVRTSGQFWPGRRATSRENRDDLMDAGKGQ